MEKIKKLLTLLLCVIICISFSATAYAADGGTTIMVSSTTAMPGDTVTVDVEILNNPGIMAMAFCITYDSDVLTYKDEYTEGYLSDYTVKGHADKGHISVVNVEEGDIVPPKDNNKIISVIFEVKKDAKPGKHPIAIANSNRDKHGSKLHNSFSNSKQQFIVPTVITGSVIVKETCENSGHKYGVWNVIDAASCTAQGLKSRTCTRCKEVEEDFIPITHDFESEWTIDKAATPDEDGIMSRHCTKCDEVTDKITFSYEEIKGDNTDNTPSNNNSSDSALGNTSSNSSNNETQSQNSSQSTATQKPVIDNTVGEKVPLQEVEKFYDYQQNIKPSLNNSEAPSDNPSQTVSDSSNITTGVVENNNSTNEEKTTPFWSTSTGIITIVLCSALSIGIIAIGIILIIRRKKTDN